MINALRMAKRGDGKHTFSLCQVIRTLRDTAHDMQDGDRQPTRGGLTANVVEC